MVDPRELVARLVEQVPGDSLAVFCAGVPWACGMSHILDLCVRHLGGIKCVLGTFASLCRCCGPKKWSGFTISSLVHAVSHWLSSESLT